MIGPLIVKCSTMHCYKPCVNLVPIMRQGEWIICRRTAVPFCDDCKAGRTPDLTKRETDEQPTTV